MNIMSFFKRPTSAPVARERLQILLAHERAVVGQSDLVAILQDEMLAVIARHFPLDPDAIKIKVDRGDAFSTLEVEVEIPTPMCANLGLDKPPVPLPRLVGTRQAAEAEG
jgi:cell division topological specificity factor